MDMGNPPPPPSFLFFLIPLLLLVNAFVYAEQSETVWMPSKNPALFPFKLFQDVSFVFID